MTNSENDHLKVVLFSSHNILSDDDGNNFGESESDCLMDDQ